jgi:hypothetical protein
MNENPTTDRNSSSRVLPQKRNTGRISLATAVAIAGAGLSIFTASPTEAAVLSVGQGIPPYGGTTCADVAGGNLDPRGVPVQAWDCHAGPNQQFELYGWTIYTVGGQRCLDVVGGGTNQGTPVQSYPCNNKPNQEWYYFEGQIKNAHPGPAGADPCLDARNMNNGTQLVINRCNGMPSQQWQIK